MKNPFTMRNAPRQALRRLFIMFCPALLLLLLLKVVFSLFYVPTGSMEPTVRAGSVQLAWRLPYIIGDPALRHGEIVAFRNDAVSDRLMLKRVIGTEGDRIDIMGGDVYVNGERLNEPYIRSNTEAYECSSFSVPEGMVFLLGDNRENSWDSRYWEKPFVPLHDIYAKLLLG